MADLHLGLRRLERRTPEVGQGLAGILVAPDVAAPQLDFGVFRERRTERLALVAVRVRLDLVGLHYRHDFSPFGVMPTPPVTVWPWLANRILRSFLPPAVSFDACSQISWRFATDTNTSPLSVLLT